MLPLRYAHRWRAAGFFLLVLVLFAALMPAVWMWPDRRAFVAWFIDVDKWLHGITFVILAIWFAGQYSRRSYWRIGIGLIFFGMLIEACQRLVTYRSSEWFDIVADTAGIIVGLAVATAGLGGWSLWIEKWLVKRKAGTGID
jgi:VanZ family protein